MDFDSSSKFISSLAKFLQSLCNGYVEFDSGVHVIGHLYLSVDTGKTIDYVLNEKVCKTDENSVTFISNSFHAEPAEKPKPPGRKDDKDKQDRLERENGDGNVEQLEPRSTNYGTIPNARGSPNGKRPHSPGRVSPRSKKSRINSSEPSNLSNDNVHSPSVDGGHGQNVPQDSSYNDSYPQTFFPPADEESTTGDPERDVKPSLDTDVTFIKEEIAAESQASHDRNQFDDPYISSMFPPSNQSHPSGGFPSNFGASPSSQRTSFGPMGERHPGMLPPGQNSSQLEPGENPNDPSASSTRPSPSGRLGHAHKCHSCDRTFATSVGLHRHVKSDHPELEPSSEPVPSLPASEKVHNQAAYKHDWSDLTPIDAADGPLGFADEVTRWDERGRDERFACHHCDNTYSDMKGLRRHLAKVQGVRYPCTMCPKEYIRLDVLRKHIRDAHGVNPLDGSIPAIVRQFE